MMMVILVILSVIVITLILGVYASSKNSQLVKIQRFNALAFHGTFGLPEPEEEYVFIRSGHYDWNLMDRSYLRGKY